jgi:hypothetical protein
MIRTDSSIKMRHLHTVSSATRDLIRNPHHSTDLSAVSIALHQRQATTDTLSKRARDTRFQRPITLNINNNNSPEAISNRATHHTNSHNSPEATSHLKALLLQHHSKCPETTTASLPRPLCTSPHTLHIGKANAIEVGVGASVGETDTENTTTIIIIIIIMMAIGHSPRRNHQENRRS